MTSTTTTAMKSITTRTAAIAKRRSNDQCTRRAAAGGRARGLIRRLRLLAVCAGSAAAFLLPAGLAGTAAAHAAAGPPAITSAWTNLTLINGWTDAPFGTSDAAARTISGIVHLRGAIASGTSSAAFILPAAFRPATEVYVPVDLCNATNGRLDIFPDGNVVVEAEGGDFSNAQCFTSLDGASYAKSASLFTNLKLVNGWTDAPFGTSDAAARAISGIVHLKGAIATTGGNPVPFTLPKAFRPATNVYVKADLCNATNGRLVIQHSGLVTVEAEGGDFSNAQCFTSLDGITYATSASSFTQLKLINGWQNTPYSTSHAAARTISGIVHLKGAMDTSGTNAVPFTLPAAFRPATEVYVPVDMCGATNGRLDIAPDGEVAVEAEGGDFSNAQCFTSLDGVSYAP